MRRCAIFFVVIGSLAASLAPAEATAQDDELRLFREPFSYTDVADAFDDDVDDQFDLNVSVGYRRSLTTGTVQRQVRDAGATGQTQHLDIAEHERLRNLLEFGVDVGLFHDLMVYGRLPVVLSDTRKLKSPDSLAAAEAELTYQEPTTGMPAQLFDVPFESPTRSGLDYLGLGLAWSIYNQHREPEVPTWVVMVEGRFSLGEPMHACNEASRYGMSAIDPAGTDNRCNGGDEPGVSEGTTTLHLETRTSWRRRYIEPYAGLSFDFGVPVGGDTLFHDTSGETISGFMNTLPPRVGEMTAGVAIIPWEQRARWQRFLVDLRLTGAYVSEGHGYSPLFDALGTSNASYLRDVNFEGVESGVGVGREVVFTGLTDMEPHGRLGGHLAIEMQAAKYVKFTAGASLYWSSPYQITFADACNPNFSPSAGDNRMGTCRNGIINPHHRSLIDLPGRRFRVDGEVTFDLFATAMAQF